MQIVKDSVVSLTYSLYDSQGNLLEESKEPISYLHGGYDNIFPLVESSLQGKQPGDTVTLSLAPEDAFGEYDASLVRVEPRSVFPVTDIRVGMQFEGGVEGSDEMILYTVTDVTEDTVVVDGNHPLAGRSLRFTCTVTDVRPATPEEIAHGHVHGPHGHDHS
ncbi:MAG: peptidylprolyl isomerase [Burkholderiales bacterium]|jgi:FKBP-type peptidyl-prolyl cis-trans isomerase SlyD|nr:peptidylprolyl isomerase [Burkholderiales bacterium]